jgi:predicted O-methyltransferase YrrM
MFIIKLSMSKYGYGQQHHSDMIVQLVKSVNCQTYLELGIYDGSTLARVGQYIPRVIGVDIKDLRSNKNIGEFHLSTTQDFLKNFKEKVDVAFIDADHSFESVKEDFTSVLPIVNELGLIILHDTDPIDAKYLDKGYCGDSYKMIDWLKSEHPNLDVLTLPISEAGLTIIKRSSDRRVNKFLNNE